MAPIQRKSVRKLVTLSPDLADRVEKYREAVGASSESDALKALIEAGLKTKDKPADLFQRCESATSGNQSIGDIINLVTSDHPLIERTVLDDESLLVYLKTESDAPDERFRYSRTRRTWHWEYQNDPFNDSTWRPVGQEKPKPQRRDDLDDEIPF